MKEDLPWVVFRRGCVAVVLLAAVIRMVGLDQVPPGLFCDEAGNGYNAFSLLKSGVDEEGTFLPLYVWSFGVSYKNPVFIYSAIPVVALLGLSETSIRLVAALWGVAGVLSFLWLGTLLFGRRGGLWSGLFLALCPWHLHFSRLAFELIAVLPLFAAGFASFLLAVRGRPRWLIGSGIFFALSLYAYAPAKMFVPLFIVGAALLHAGELWRNARWCAAGALAAIVTGLPVAIFDLTHGDKSRQYFRDTTILRDSMSVLENANRVFENWKTFFTPDFLFHYGDPLFRHSVPDVGQLYFAMILPVLLGCIWALWRHRPGGKLLLWWLVLFPIAPSLMNEVPSASRGFMGAGVFCLLSAAGMAALYNWLRRRGGALRWLHDIAVSLILATLLFEAGRLGYRYVTVYPAAASNDFQYGYREALELMEPLRDSYDTLLMTTTDGNQAQIFPLFYNEVLPETWLERRNSGYVIVDPAEFGRYDPKKNKVLAALRDNDLGLFDKIGVKGEVRDPNGNRVFTIAEIEKRGLFAREWLLLGVFDNSDGRAMHEEHFPNHTPDLDAYPSDDGSLYWRRVLPIFVRIELHHFYRPSIEPSGEEPVWVCAYAATNLVAERATTVRVEFDGPPQWLQTWLRGQPTSDRVKQIGSHSAFEVLELEAGDNPLLLKTCRGNADWWFSARLRGTDGGSVDGVEARAVIPVTDPPAGAAAVVPAPTQLVSGFSRVLSFSHEHAFDSDYRGGSPGWIEHLYDHNGAVTWETGQVPAVAETAVVFTARVSPVAGRAQLWVDGRFALEFDTGRFELPMRWQRDGFVLRYFPEETSDFQAGSWVLQVPRQYTRAGHPLVLRVSHVDGGRDASFMLKGYSDTAEHEGVTLSSLGGGAR